MLNPGGSRSIRSRIFVSYTLILVVLTVFFTSSLSLFLFQTLKANATESLTGLSKSLSVNLDESLKRLDEDNLNVMYSYLIKDQFQVYAEDLKPEGGETDSLLTYQDDEQRILVNEIVGMLVSVRGLRDSVAQIALHSFDGLSINTTNRNHVESFVESMAWFNDVVAREGHLYITRPYYGYDDRMSTDRFTDESLISICRVFFDTTNTPIGIIESKQYAFKIFSEVELTDSRDKYSVIVFNERGETVYPYHSGSKTNEAEVVFRKLLEDMNSGSPVVTRVSMDSGSRIVSTQRLGHSGWTLIFGISEKTFLAPLRRMIFTIFGISILAGAVMLFISYLTARRITTPIAELSGLMHRMEIGDLDTPLDIQSNITEIKSLKVSFVNMKRQLSESLNRELLAQQHELQAKMLALQSQINPHFIYNTFAVIHAMADENMTKEIRELSSDVSDILRYLASDNRLTVPMSEELHYTELYLQCMKHRYEDDITYKFDVTGIPEDLEVPKLSIQPLVENAMKYATVTSPPWNIEITVRIDQDLFVVSVRDNGPGFKPEVLARIREQIEVIDTSNLLPHLKLEGMGLLNLYTRLKLRYGNHLTFRIGDNENGGAVLVFGTITDPSI